MKNTDCVLDSNFHIDAGNIPDILEIVNRETYHDTDDIGFVFKSTGYRIHMDDDDNIVDISLDDTMAHATTSTFTQQVFRILAPYVEPGSYIVTRVGGHHLKMTFYDGDCAMTNGHVSFDQVYDEEYVATIEQSHIIGGVPTLRVTVHAFDSFGKAFAYVMKCHGNADSIEPLILYTKNSQVSMQVGYAFRYDPYRLSSAPGGDLVRVTIEKVSRSTPFSDYTLPRVPTDVHRKGGDK